MHLLTILWPQLSMLRILMFCMYGFQDQINSFIYTSSCLQSQVVFFPIVPTLGVQNLFFPGQYLPVNTRLKTGYRPKPSNPDGVYTCITEIALQEYCRNRHAYKRELSGVINCLIFVDVDNKLHFIRGTFYVLIIYLFLCNYF